MADAKQPFPTEAAMIRAAASSEYLARADAVVRQLLRDPHLSPGAVRHLEGVKKGFTGGRSGSREED